MRFLKKTIYGLGLTLLLANSSVADCSYELFSISSTRDTKIIDFIEELSDECEFSIVIGDKKTETYLNKRLNKTHLKNLTIDEVLKVILQENNLTYTLSDNILKINYLTTKVFSIDYILSQRASTGTTDVTLSSSSNLGAGSATAESGIKIASSDSVKFWEELDTEFQSILNRVHDSYVAEKPIINKNAGLITVTATYKQLKRFEDYLKKLQSKVQLQVLIDVQLLSVTMSEGKTTGIDWQQIYALQNLNLSFGYESSDNNGVNSENKYISISGSGSLKEIIKFLKSQGDVNSISNPKVLTLNNQPALITSGTEYFYKMVSTETLAGGTTGTQSQSENIESVFAGVLLDITPEISGDDTITLKINPSISETINDISSSTSDARTMPPDLNRRQLSSVVTVKDGNRIILGGLINTKTTLNSTKVPILGDIPLLDNFFSYESKTKQVQELVIIIQPHIIDKSKSDISLSKFGFGIIKDKNSTKEVK